MAEACPQAATETTIPRGTYFGRFIGEPPEDEAENFIRCPACDGWIDCRDLAPSVRARRAVATSNEGPATVGLGSGAITGFPAPPAEQGLGTARLESLLSCPS